MTFELYHNPEYSTNNNNQSIEQKKKNLLVEDQIFVMVDIVSIFDMVYSNVFLDILHHEDTKFHNTKIRQQT